MIFDTDIFKSYANVAAYMAVSGFGLALLFWFVGVLIRLGISLVKSVRSAA